LAGGGEKEKWVATKGTGCRAKLYIRKGGCGKMLLDCCGGFEEKRAEEGVTFLSCGGGGERIERRVKGIVKSLC